jgi:hypothetical protein
MLNAIVHKLPEAALDVIERDMATKKQKRLNIHWSPEWDEKIVTKAKQLAIGRDVSFSAFVAEALRREVERELMLQEKGKKK